MGPLAGPGADSNGIESILKMHKLNEVKNVVMGMFLDWWRMLSGHQNGLSGGGACRRLDPFRVMVTDEKRSLKHHGPGIHFKYP